MKVKTVKRDGIKFSFINKQDFEFHYNQAFILKVYNFVTQNPAPFIIDCGSNIGLTILHFKKNYPKATIIGFEPNPISFKLLSKNIKQNNFKNVTLYNHALFKREEKINLYVTRDPNLRWATADSTVKTKWYDPKVYKTIKVSARKLSPFIKEKVDLLKMDIEGVEELVLKEIENKLHFVNEIFMEFHGMKSNESNNLARILSILRRNRFSYTLKQEKKTITESEIPKEDWYRLMIYAKQKSLDNYIF